MGVGSTYGQTAEDSKANGRIIICTGKASTPGKMAGSMKVNMLTTESMVMELTLGQMVDNIPDSGKMVSSTDKVLTDRLQDKKEEVSGKMVKEYNGLMNDRLTLYNYFYY
jgi:DNA-binding transcriptional regulator YhcF (GntR family)